MIASNAFSKEVENLSAAVALQFMPCNFARPSGWWPGRVAAPTPRQPPTVPATRR